VRARSIIQSGIAETGTNSLKNIMSAILQGRFLLEETRKNKKGEKMDLDLAERLFVRETRKIKKNPKRSSHARFFSVDMSVTKICLGPTSDNPNSP
jgi:hypothetical protein